MAADDLQARFDAVSLSKAAQPEEAIQALRQICTGESSNTPDNIKVKEQAILKLADLYVKREDAAALKHMLTELRPLFNHLPKAKTAKIVRTIIETIAKVPNSAQLQVRAWLHTREHPATSPAA